MILRELGVDRGVGAGRVFNNGRAGERFAVRNSLAETVVEGTGDHCCEYMTGGAVVVLGKVGRNVGAGMTGGLGYFLDEDESFPTKVNGEIVSMQRVSSQAGEAQLKALIEAHVAKTGSPKGAFVLVNWKEYLPKFWQLVPPSEANTPEASDRLCRRRRSRRRERRTKALSLLSRTEPSRARRASSTMVGYWF